MSPRSVRRLTVEHKRSKISPPKPNETITKSTDTLNLCLATKAILDQHQLSELRSIGTSPALLQSARGFGGPAEQHRWRGQGEERGRASIARHQLGRAIKPGGRWTPHQFHLRRFKRHGTAGAYSLYISATLRISTLDYVYFLKIFFFVIRNNETTLAAFSTCRVLSLAVKSSGVTAA